MFAMKASAARVATDSEDLITLAGHLGITTAEEALAILEKYYSPERLLPKSSLLLESLFPRADVGGRLHLERKPGSFGLGMR